MWMQVPTALSGILTLEFFSNDDTVVGAGVIFGFTTSIDGMGSGDGNENIDGMRVMHRCNGEQIQLICRFGKLGPRYEGQLTRMAEPIPPSGQSSSYSLTTLSSSSSTDRRAETDRIVITTRIAVARHFRCRLRRRESCILGATSSQLTLALHELPPSRLVIH